jgi:hypothetical protein
MKPWQLALIASLVVVGLFFVDGGQIYVRQLLNRAPKAAFTYRTPTRTLKYIAPTDRDTIMFLNNSTDPDGDPLISKWYVRYNGTGDWKLLNSSRDHWGRLPLSNEKGHEIRLAISDGTKEDSASVILPVDPGRLSQYSQAKLGIPIKSITYFTGRHFAGEFGDPPTEDEMVESLTIIRARGELGCNAISLEGDYEDVTLRCAEIAMTAGFKEIILVPRYCKKNPDTDITMDEHVEKTVAFSKKAEELRKKSDTIVLSIGTELTFTVRGITSGLTKTERIKEMEGKTGDDYPPEMRDRLNAYLKKILDGVRPNFHGKVTYCSAVGERFAVAWKELDLDIVAPHLYTWNYLPPTPQEWMLRVVRRLRQPGKPFYASEFGCETFIGSANDEDYKGQTYSQDEQAKNIIDSIGNMEKAGIDGMNLWAFLYKGVPDVESYGVLRWEKNSMQRRKLGFYAYQSFTLS